MNKIRTVTGDQVCRSLIQKAVRRGALSVVEKAVVHLIQKGEITWLKNRLGVIAFEESWAYTSRLQFTTSEDSLIKQYIDIAKSSKNKNAAGLGSLAYELSKGTETVLVRNDPTNKHIKIVAEAIKRPSDFWTWAKKTNPDEGTLGFLEKAEIGFKLAGWPWDKAFAIASAYLFVCGELQDLETNSSFDSIDFPYWVAIDKHTSAGKIALVKCSEKFDLNKTTLGWIQFYLESAKCENLQASFWWEREKAWRLTSEGVGGGKADIIWRETSDYLHSTLTSQEAAIKNDIEHSFNQHKTTLKNQKKLI